MWRGLRAIKKYFFHWTILVLVVPVMTLAWTPKASFWRNRQWTLKFTSGAQSILAGNCSGVTTVGTYNTLGVQANVTSSLTVNLSSSGTVTFYSDSSCTLATTSVTVASGTSSKNFYYIDTAVGTTTLTASASNYKPASQDETNSTNPFVWTGGGGNASWSTGANWSGGTAPGSTQLALFDGTCSSNCSPQINSNINVKGVRLSTGYSSTITQATGNTVTIGSLGWVHMSGTFVGGNSAISFSEGALRIHGGTYTSTSGTLSFYSFAGGTVTYFVNSSASQFVHNSGLVFVDGLATNGSFDADQTSFNNLNLTSNQVGLDLAGKAIFVAGALTLTDTNTWMGAISNGTINLTGNLTVTSRGKAGTGKIKIIGSGNQTIDTSAATLPTVPGIEYASTGGTVTVNGNLRVRGNLEYTSGTISDASTTYTLVNDKTITPGGRTWGNVELLEGNFGLGGQTMIVGGSLKLAATDDYTYIQAGTIEARGDVTFESKGKRTANDGYLKIAGSSNQTITTTAATSPRTGNFEIASTGGTVTINGDLVSAGLLGNTHTIRHTSGTVSWPSGTLSISSDGTTLHFYPGTMSCPNVSIQTSNGTSINLHNGTLAVAGNLTVGDGAGWPGDMSNGIVQVGGSVTFNSNGKYGTATQLQLVGSNSSTLNVPTSAKYNGNWTINRSTGTVTLSSNLSLNTAGQALTITSGTVDMAGKNLAVAGALTISSGATLTCNGGVLTYGSIVNNGTLNCP